MNKALLPLLLALGLLSAASCNFYRRIAGRKPSTPTVDSSLITVRDSVLSTVDTGFSSTATVTEPRRTDSALFLVLLPRWNAQMAWATFSGKAKVHYEGGGESLDFTAAIRMERGKSVWMSVTALGLFEAARVLIRPDSIFVLDRIHREARALAFSDAGKLLPIRADFAALQSIITGDAVQTGRQPTVARDTAGMLVISVTAPDFSQSLQFDPQDTSLHFQAITEGGTFLLVESTGYRQAGTARSFADGRNLFITDKGEHHVLNLGFSKADFDEAVELPFSIPEKYERK